VELKETQLSDCESDSSLKRNLGCSIFWYHQTKTGHFFQDTLYQRQSILHSTGYAQ